MMFERVPHSRSGQIMLHVIVVLADGKWHRWEDVVREVARTIPRGAALRLNESERRRVARHRLGVAPGRVHPLSVEGQHRAGARTMIRWAMGNQRGAVEHQDGRVRLRWVPTRLVGYLPDDLVLAASIPRGRPPEAGPA
jgi:hypothetical protein